MTERICLGCGKTKPISAFPATVDRGRPRIRRRCRECELARYREPKKKMQDRANGRKRRAEGRTADKDRRHTQRRNELYPEKLRAKWAVQYAIQKGTLVRPLACERCGRAPLPKRNGASNIQAHHPDYSEPLSVIWLCDACHIQEHHNSPAPPHVAEQREMS